MNERDALFCLATVLEKTDQKKEAIEALKKMIEINPAISMNKLYMLSISYKNAITDNRNGIRILDTIVNDPNMKNSERLEKIKRIRTELITELNSTCNELINLIEQTLLPNNTSTQHQLFLKKLEADYYRYICENNDNNEQNILVQKAKDCYNEAMKISKESLQQSDPQAIELALNYSVFLYDVLGKKEEAIQFAQNTYNENCAIVRQSSDNSAQEASRFLQNLSENIQLWKTNQ